MKKPSTGVRYRILITLKDLSHLQKVAIESLGADHSIIVPLAPGVMSNYIYVREDVPKEVLSKIRSISNFSAMTQFIDEAEALAFVGRLEDYGSLKEGDFVKVPGYGQMVFVIQETYEDGKCLVRSMIRNTSVEVVVDLSSVRKHDNPQYFLYTETGETPHKGHLVIDSDYFCRFVDVKAFRSMVNFLVRIKVQFRGYRVCFSSLGSPLKKELKALVQAFGLGYTDKSFAKGSYLFSDKNYYLKCFEGVLNMEEDQLVLIDGAGMDRSRYSYLHYLKYLKDTGQLDLSLSWDEISCFIAQSNWADIRDRFWPWKSELSYLDVLDMTLVEPVVLPFHREDLISIMRKKNHLWFVENSDFYIDTIRS